MMNVSIQLIMGQLLIGVINGAFYAILSLGLAVIFGLLRVINFAHGAQYMLGAVTAWLLLQYGGIGYWPALFLAPAIVGVFALIIERLLLRRIYNLDHLYGLLLTFGLALIIEGSMRHWLGAAGKPYAAPALLTGVWNLGIVVIPIYRAFIVAASLAACFLVWLLIEKTKIGSYLRAATENAALVETFGVNVPVLLSATYVLGAMLAAFAGVLAAPIYQVSPLMGSHLIIVVFAVVVAGGMGSIMGAVVTGFGLGILEGLTKVVYPQAATVVIFVVMAIVLLYRPAGLFGRETALPTAAHAVGIASRLTKKVLVPAALFALAVVLLAPFFVYPTFATRVLCFVLFASAFNLLIGYVGLLSFGHAAFFGGSAYITAHALKVWGFPPEISILAGVAFASAIGLLFGLLAIRRQGIYFAMITLALGQMVYFCFLQAPFAGGEDGIQAVPRGFLFGIFDLSNPIVLYYTVLLIVSLALAATWRMLNSPFGSILTAVRDNEVRAVSLGYRAERYKLGAFVISAALAGLAGSLKVITVQIASLTDVTWQMSGEVVLMTLLGGMGTFFGPAAGAAIITIIEHYSAGFAVPAPVVTGTLFVVCVLVFRRGVVGEIISLLGMRKRADNSQVSSNSIPEKR
ncbi:branched-chain amino acid ABC transporter permease [Pseudochrobactrum sp. sp1633]|nr:branched-chain amino acid ABC transporter permease [Pseudochrobactrum sp. sp1633]